MDTHYQQYDPKSLLLGLIGREAPPFTLSFQYGEQRPTPNAACEHYSSMLVPSSITYTSTFKNASMGAMGVAKSGARLPNGM